MVKKYIRIWQALNIIERIQKKQKKHYGITPVFLALNTAKDYIKNLPAADVQEVKHGEWIHIESSDTQTNKAYKCSHCKRLQYYITCDRPLYCPNCGAKMDTWNFKSSEDAIPFNDTTKISIR